MPCCCAWKQQVAEKASYLAPACRGGGEFITMSSNSKHANLLYIEGAHKIFGGLIFGEAVLFILFFSCSSGGRISKKKC